MSNSERHPCDELAQESAEQLVRQLLEHARTTESADPVVADPCEVVLDMNLDGYRYVLRRTRSELRVEHALSPRELEIARLVARGLPNKTIGVVLDISIWTVSTHLRRIFGKLQVHSRAEMVAQLFGTGGDSLARSDRGSASERPAWLPTCGPKLNALFQSGSKTSLAGRSASKAGKY